jgi:hypothetical protein
MRLCGLSVILFALAGCGSDGSGDPPVTALVVRVTFSVAGVDSLHATGTAMASGRAFGPFDIQGDSVRSGATVGLLFDPGDAGDAQVCIEARHGSAPLASACGSFVVQADAVTHGALDLRGRGD